MGATQHEAVLHTDGGSRGNPGPAGCGFVLEVVGAAEQVCGGWFIGTATNNAAEYGALIWGMRNALAAGVATLHVQADSKLVVEQMRGAYKVKNANIKPLFLDAMELVRQFAGGVTFEHVYRESNSEADRLANEAMDAKGAVGSYLVDMDGAPAAQAIEPVVASFGADADTYEFELTVCVDVRATRTLEGFGPAATSPHPVRWKVGAELVRSSLGEAHEVYDAERLQGLLADVLAPCQGALLNGQPLLRGANPTIEALARAVLSALSERLEAEGASALLDSVTVWAGANVKATARRCA